MRQLLSLLIVVIQLCMVLPASSNEEPLAPWGVHTLVSEGRSTFEGEKLRAVLVYGETGARRLTIELINVEMGHPNPSQVIWRARLDVIGEAADPCPVAEMYCATIQHLRWSSGELLYEIVSPSQTLQCRVSGIRAQDPRTVCRTT